MEDGVEPATPLEFADLVRQHQAMVFSIGYHFLRDRTAAEELAQEVFLQLHRNLATLESPDHITYWLRKVASNRAIDFARRKKLRPQISLDDVPEPSTAPSAGDPMLSRTLQRLVASLPEKPRMVVVLRFQEDLDPLEIADLLEMPVRTVKSLLQRSLALLRQKLERSVGRENI